MSTTPIAFARGYQERLVEYKKIFSFISEFSKIQKVWEKYVEVAIEPTGWQAIWKMSRDLCFDLKINFPFTAIVVVDQVNFKDLSCLVSITQVEDDTIQLPDKMADVPLIELYPTVEQDSSYAMEVIPTADLIDSLRFFYNHLWMPWDEDSEEDVSWVDSHLEERLRLYFLMVEKKVPYGVIHTVRNLIAESRKIKKEIEAQVQEIEEMNIDASPARMLKLTELHNQLSNFKNQFAIYQKPHLLEALIERMKTDEKAYQELQSSECPVFLVLTTTTSERLLSLAKFTMNTATKKEVIRLSVSLQDALDKVPVGGAVWLGQGTYPIRDLGNLQTGGTLMSVEPNVVVTDNVVGCSTIDVLEGSLLLSTLNLHMNSVWDIIKVKSGADCMLKEIKLEGSTVTDGVDVYSGAKLSAMNCHFTGCRTAITCSTNSTVHLFNCTFSDNNVALDLRMGCNLEMENCNISGSKCCGVYVENAKPKGDIFIGCINSIPGVKESGTVCTNNASDVNFLPGSEEELINQNGEPHVDYFAK